MTTRGSLARGQGQTQYQGNVQKWIRKWVEPGTTPGSSKMALLKWVPTGDRSGSKPGPRFPHLQPVTDPNLKLPAGQNDKGKKPVARMLEQPVQAVAPSAIENGEPARRAADGAGTASTGMKGAPQHAEAAQQSAQQQPAVQSEKADPAISQQFSGPSTEQHAPVQPVPEGREKTQQPDQAPDTIPPEGSNKVQQPDRAPGSRAPGPIGAPQSGKGAAVDAAVAPDLAAEQPARVAQEQNTAPEATQVDPDADTEAGTEVEVEQVPSSAAAAAAADDEPASEIFTSAEQLSKAGAAPSGVPDAAATVGEVTEEALSAQQSGGTLVEGVTAEQSEEAVQAVQLAAAVALLSGNADGQNDSGERPAVGASGADQHTPSKRPAEALGLEAQPFLKRHKEDMDTEDAAEQ